jgi:D-alanyl-D-alanine carboxypeptidase
MKQATLSIVTAVASMTLVAGAFVAGAAATVWPQGAPAAAAGALSLSPSALEARAAVVLDLKTGDILYQKDAQEPLPLASLTKLMTLQAALSERDLATPVTITLQDLAPEGDWGLRAGDTLALRDLIALALVASSNDAAAAVASTLGPGYLDAINGTAQTLDLTRTNANNPTGLDMGTASGDAGAYGSAFDVARLAAAFWRAHPELFALTTQPTVTIQDGARTLTFKATMAPVQDLPGFLGAKTGYTDLAGGNLAAIVDLEPGHPVAVVVLHSTQAGRFSDVRTLVEALRAAHPTP